MQIITKHPNGDKLKVGAEARKGLETWLYQEIEDSFAARSNLEQQWQENLRLYEGEPKRPVRNEIIENAPNVEVNISAIAVDSIYSQVIDLIYSISPLITVRAVQGKPPIWIEIAKSVQQFVNWVAANEARIRAPSENSILDCVQMGTMAYYIPWTEKIKKNDVQKVVDSGPAVISIPCEDILVPGGAFDDPQKIRWLGLRFYYTQSELDAYAERGKWRIKGVKPASALDWVRQKREQLGRTNSNMGASQARSKRYEILMVWCEYDIDGDGIDEDLLVIYDRNSRKILKEQYNPYDNRPIEVGRYQLRAHLFHGIGVPEMMGQFQNQISDTWNYWTLNMILANARFVVTKTGTFPSDQKMWPNKNLEVDDINDIKFEQMGNVYSSGPQSINMGIGLAERRVGLNDLTSTKPSAVMGSRTPGITALTMVQQVNKRFTAAFDSMRMATAGAVRQCMFRYKEQLLKGNKKIEQHIMDVIGEEDGARVIAALREPDLEESVHIELTASSASINKEADRQNAIMLTNLLGTYYQKVLELTSIAANPQTPKAVRQVAIDIATKAGEIIDRTVRTFDSIRDPSTFTIEIEDVLNSSQGAQQGAVQQLMGMLMQAGGAQGQPSGGAPPQQDGGGETPVP